MVLNLVEDANLVCCLRWVGVLSPSFSPIRSLANWDELPVPSPVHQAQVRDEWCVDVAVLVYLFVSDFSAKDPFVELKNFQP